MEVRFDRKALDKGQGRVQKIHSNKASSKRSSQEGPQTLALPCVASSLTLEVP
jgi:hypothetical protein